MSHEKAFAVPASLRLSATLVLLLTAAAPAATLSETVEPGRAERGFDSLPLISEIRIDQPGSDDDQYFELAGVPGTGLDGLTYLVIGDSTGGGSGVVEEVTHLAGLSIPERGFFVAAESSFSLGTADLTTTLSFENSDNVTHLLVSGFTGAGGQDLDLDDDGVLDQTPWTQVVDCLAVVETPGEGDRVYCEALGPLGVHVPFHVYRCASGWQIGAEPVAIVDTPGAAGDCCRLDPACLYAGLDELDRTGLRQSLHEVVHDHAIVDFDDSDQSFALLELADEYLEDPAAATILDLYKNAVYDKVETGRPYAREHTWPQAYGLSDGFTGVYPRCDHHALFLADSGYNGSRSNLPYDTCGAACAPKPTDHNNGQGGEDPPPSYPGDSNWRTGAGSTGTWETWAGSRGGRRGDVARALFYLDVRYDSTGHRDGTAEPDLVLTSDRSLIQADDPYMGNLSTLLAWHEQDPPDAQEIWHNEVVALFQKNRNPFVDRPDLVRCVYLMDCGIFADGFESGDATAWSVSSP